MSQAKRDAAKTAKWILDRTCEYKATERHRLQMYVLLPRRLDMQSTNFLFVVSGTADDHSLFRSEFARDKNVMILCTNQDKLLEQVIDHLKTTQTQVIIFLYSLNEKKCHLTVSRQCVYFSQESLHLVEDYIRIHHHVTSEARRGQYSQMDSES